MQHVSPGKLLLAGTSPLVLPRALLSPSIRADAGDPKAMLAEIQKAVAELRQKNDEALAKKADVVVTDQVNRINASVGELQATIDAMNVKMAALAVGGGGRSPQDPEGTDAFTAHMRKGDVKASLKKDPNGDGGYLAPSEWDRTITDRLVILSPMRQIARVQAISVASFSKLFNSRGTGSGWVGETAARPETSTPTIGQLTYTTGEIYANPSATQQLLDDAQVDVERWLADNVETEFGYQEGIAFVAGNGVNKPNGFLTYATGAANAAAHPWGAIQVTTAASATAVTTDEVMGLTYALPAAYTGGARYVMNRASLFNVRKLKDVGGNYIWQPTFTEGQPQSLAGYPITEMPAMPNMVSGALPIAFGDFQRGYLIVDRFGVRVLRDPFTNKPFVMFYTTKRVGGGLLDPDAIKVLKMA